MKNIFLTLLLVLFAVRLSASDAVVRDTIVIAQDGSGDFTNFYDAINEKSIPTMRAYMEYSIYIYVKKGVYKEKVVIPAWFRNIIIEGECADSTVLTFDDYAGKNKMGTFRSHTLRIDASRVTIKNMTIENSAGRVGQAVALHTEGDRLTFINCRFLGDQDTVFTGGERARLYFSDCYIEGTTDFIFGPATAWFENCTLHGKVNSYITAASTPQESEYGYIFNNCRITAAPEVTALYLGRPWRRFAYTAFLNCEMDAPIVPEGWDNWRNKENEKTVKYMEYASYGKGADDKCRAKWSRILTKKQVKKITHESVFGYDDKWLPEN